MPRGADFVGVWKFYDSSQGERVNSHLQSYLETLNKHEEELQPWFFQHQTALRRLDERRGTLAEQLEAMQLELATVDEDRETLKKVVDTTTQRYEGIVQEREEVRAQKTRAEKGLQDARAEEQAAAERVSPESSANPMFNLSASVLGQEQDSPVQRAPTFLKSNTASGLSKVLRLGRISYPRAHLARGRL